jgi:NADPH:quinone reductase-like Zn-dependent oxidoreductase
MKAVRIHTYGGPEVLVYEDAPRPTPAAGEVLVKVYATSVNPVDRATRAGYLQGRGDFALPFTPGLDLAGAPLARHFHVTGHPIIHSFEPGESWR